MLISFLPPLKKVSFCLTEILGNKVILAVRSALHLILHSLLRWMFFFPEVLQRLPITRDLLSSKELDIVTFWWTSKKEKPLELF